MILMIYTSFSSFVKVDHEILSQKYFVKTYKYSNTKSIYLHVINQIKMGVWLISNIRKCNAVYIWFADYHSFLPILFSKIFRKKSFLVLGGYDVTYLPEYNYGSFNNPLRAFFTRYSISHANINLAVSDNIKNDALERVPNANINILYTGYSDKKFPLNIEKNDLEILSVCEANTLQRAYIKGVDLIFATAKLLPEFNFKIVALDKKLVRNNFQISKNIILIEHLDQNKLIEFYRSASIYIQLSLREGLPNSVCEAMLCGCIPVGTNSGGIPIAIGDTGYISLSRDPNEISKLIKQAKNANNDDRLKSRKRIIDNFSLEMRTNKLLFTIEKFLNIK